MKRGDIYWADLGPPAGRRPVLILSRDAAIPVLSAVVVAPLTRTIRGIASEVKLGRDEGLPDDCVASCDNLMTIPKDRLDQGAAGSLDVRKNVELDGALRFALQIDF